MRGGSFHPQTATLHDFARPGLDWRTDRAAAGTLAKSPDRRWLWPDRIRGWPRKIDGRSVRPFIDWLPKRLTRGRRSDRFSTRIPITSVFFSAGSQMINPTADPRRTSTAAESERLARVFLPIFAPYLRAIGSGVFLVGVAFLAVGLASAAIYARTSEANFLRLVFFADIPAPVRSAIESGLPIQTAFVNPGFLSSLAALYGAMLTNIAVSVAVPWKPSRLFQLHSAMLGVVAGYYISIIVLGISTNGIFYDVLRLAYILIIYVTIERLKAIDFSKMPAGYYYPYLLDGIFALLTTLIFVQLAKTPTEAAFSSPLFLLSSFIAMPVAEQTLVRLKVAATLANDDFFDQADGYDMNQIMSLPQPQKARVIVLLFFELLKQQLVSAWKYARMSWGDLEITFRSRVPSPALIRSIMRDVPPRVDRGALIITCAVLTVWAPLLAVAATLGLRVQIWLLKSLGLIGG